MTFRSRSELLEKADRGPEQNDNPRLTVGGGSGSGGVGGTGARTLSISIVGLPSHDTSKPLLRFKLTEPWTFDNSAGVADSDVAATASSVFSIQRNGSQVGTVTFGAGSTTGVVAWTSLAYTAGQIFELYPPASADTTLDEVSISLPFVVG